MSQIKIKSIPGNIEKLVKCHPGVKVNEIKKYDPKQNIPGEYLIDGIEESIAKQFSVELPVVQLKPLSQPSEQEIPEVVQNLFNGLMSFKQSVDNTTQSKIDQFNSQIELMLKSHKDELQILLDHQKTELTQKMQELNMLAEGYKAAFKKQEQEAVANFRNEMTPIRNSIATLQENLNQLRSFIDEEKKKGDKNGIAATAMFESIQKAISDFLKTVDDNESSNTDQGTPSYPFVIETKKK